MKVAISRSSSGLTFSVRVTTRAGRTGIAGVRGEALAVRLAAAPVDDAANDTLISFLADWFDRPRRDVRILSGQTSRDKRIAIAGLTETEFEARLDDILTG